MDVEKTKEEEDEEEVEEGQRRQSKCGDERMRGKGGEKRGERDSEEDGGPMPADAVHLILVQHPLCHGSLLQEQPITAQPSPTDPPTADGKMGEKKPAEGAV